MLMAAEEKRGRPNMADIQALRYGWKTSTELTEFVAQLRDQAAQLEGFVRALTDQNADEVYIDGVTKMARGIELADEFNQNVQVGIFKKKIRNTADTKKRIKRS